MIGLLQACAPTAPAEHVEVAVRREGARVVITADEVRLEAPVVELARADRRLVLVGMVHVAEPAFYAAAAEEVSTCAAVVREGLAADPSEPGPDDALGPLLEARGLARQHDVLDDDAWLVVDGSVAEVRATLRDAGAGQDEIASLLRDRGQASLHELLQNLPSDPRSDALARFTVLRGMALPDPVTGPRADRYWEVVIGDRDRLVVDAVEASGACVVYGADHVPDLEARLTRRGWTRVDERWLTAIRVDASVLGLGPTQIRQRLDGGN